MEIKWVQVLIYIFITAIIGGFIHEMVYEMHENKFKFMDKNNRLHRIIFFFIIIFFAVIFLISVHYFVINFVHLKRFTFESEFMKNIKRKLR